MSAVVPRLESRRVHCKRRASGGDSDVSELGVQLGCMIVSGRYVAPANHTQMLPHSLKCPESSTRFSMLAPGFGGVIASSSPGWRLRGDNMFEGGTLAHGDRFRFR